MSDGLAKLEPGEGDTLVIAGMGGPLMERILKDGAKVREGFQELILQPQSDLPHFRHFLSEIGWEIVREEMIKEDGKFYPMMKAVRNNSGEKTVYTEEEAWFGLNTGKEPVLSQNNLLTTIAWKLGDQTTYALEGSVFVGGAVVQWLRDGIGLIPNASITEQMAKSVSDNGGAYFVPALTGLGAPYWDQYARGAIIGITRGTTAAHLTRAALEGICYQVYDVLMAMENDIHAKPKEIRVDGGAIANNFLMQFQSDICRCPVVRPNVLETTALGAAYLAGLAIGYWKDIDELKEQWCLDKVFNPQMKEDTARKLLNEWNKAVGRSQNWAE